MVVRKWVNVSNCGLLAYSSSHVLNYSYAKVGASEVTSKWHCDWGHNSPNQECFRYAFIERQKRGTNIIHVVHRLYRFQHLSYPYRRITKCKILSIITIPMPMSVNALMPSGPCLKNRFNWKLIKVVIIYQKECYYRGELLALHAFLVCKNDECLIVYSLP